MTGKRGLILPDFASNFELQKTMEYKPYIPAPIQNIPIQTRHPQIGYIQPIEEDIEHIIHKIAAGTQTQPLGIANMEEIKTSKVYDQIYI